MSSTPPPGADELARLLLDSVSDEAIFALDAAGRVSRWSPGARAVTGWSDADVLGVHCSSFYGGEDVQLGLPERELRRAQQTGRDESEGWRVRKDGSRFWAQVITTVLRDGEGRLAGYARVIRDTTERIRAEEALRLSEARFSGIISISTDAVVSVDEQQRILLFNQGAERIFGWTAAEAIGQPLSLLLPARVHERHTHHIRAFAQGPVPAKRMGERQEIYGRRRDGSEFPAEASISRLELAGARYFTAVLRDITDRKEAEARVAEALVREQEARAAAEAAEQRTRFLADAGARLLESLDRDTVLRTLARVAVPVLADWCVVFIREDDGEVRRLAVEHRDAAAEPLSRELVGMPADATSAHPAVRAMDTREPVLVEHVDPSLAGIARNDEHARILRGLGMEAVLCVPLAVRDTVIGAIELVMAGSGRRWDAAMTGVARELASRAALAVENTRLYSAARGAIRAREDVLHVVSHDLGNSLSAIIVTTTVLLRTLPEDEGSGEMRKRISSIRDLSRRMQRLRQDLLDVASIESGRLAIEWDSFDPGALASQAADDFAGLAGEKEVTVERDITDGLPVLAGDRERILQVLANLLGNAVKFTPQGGRVGVCVRGEEDEMRFEVWDTGPGIAPDDLGHVFDRFWKVRAANRHGAGLGLAIAKGIVEAHDGRIWAESTQGEGSTFVFTLPVHEGLEEVEEE